MANHLKQPNAIVPEDWPCKCDFGCPCPPLTDIQCFLETVDLAISLSPTLTYYTPGPDPAPDNPYLWAYVDEFSNEVSIRCYNGQYSVYVLVPPDEWDGSIGGMEILECGDLGGGFSGVRFLIGGPHDGLNILLYWSTP